MKDQNGGPTRSPLSTFPVPFRHEGAIHQRGSGVQAAFHGAAARPPSVAYRLGNAHSTTRLVVGLGHVVHLSQPDLCVVPTQVTQHDDQGLEERDMN